MDATQFHPSPYFKSADFLAGPRVLTIQGCSIVTFDGGEQKPALLHSKFFPAMGGVNKKVRSPR